MTKETQSTTVSATASQADVTSVVPATEGENASAAQPDVNAQITAAVAAENSRIMGILNCEEAHGREEQAACWQKPRYDRGNGPPHSGRSTRVHRRAVTLRWIV
ncbi:hypothetical protein EsCd1HHP049_05204 [Escherichia sp. HH154_1D]|nr:hypothetical protein EsCd1HHP049_05204 [Escherichia sp. HH154_1D]